jgi:NTP pyrophosphatase (non-canonical NTP hydrolase)
MLMGMVQLKVPVEINRVSRTANREVINHLAKDAGVVQGGDFLAINHLILSRTQHRIRLESIEMSDGLQLLLLELREFSKKRDWEQFHSPKNLSMALAAEAGELLEEFQWLSEIESRNMDQSKKLEVSLEMADILLYLIRMADVLDINLLEVGKKKIALNHKKYPVALSKGNSQKYSKLK